MIFENYTIDKLAYFYGPYKLDQDYQPETWMKFEEKSEVEEEEDFVDNKWKSVKNFILNNNQKTFNKQVIGIFMLP